MLRGDRAQVAQDVLGGRPGAALLPLALELAADDVGVEVEKRELLELVAHGVLEQVASATRCVIARPPSPAMTV